MLDRPARHERAKRATGNRAVLVQLDFGDGRSQENLTELRELARSAGADIVGEVTGRRARPDAALFLGKGKAMEVAQRCALVHSDLVIVNHQLSGAQERNLEESLQCRVVDRITLILDIFAQRAQSAEGKLQVELAQLEHLATRLVRGWTHLERQKGGIGLRGPGETQLETDRRLLRNRVKVLRGRLTKVARQRHTQRRARVRHQIRNVALVGYTNAGKSTLFNRLTKAAAYSADQLFATLDTTLRKLSVAGAAPIVLSDTVGFIRDLPHELIAAFRATLQEATEADLLLHVVDSNHPDRDQHITQVSKVLSEIGAGERPQILVWNKCDLSGIAPGSERDEYGRIRAVRLSALTGAGCDRIHELLRERFPVPSEPSDSLLLAPAYGQ